MNGTNDHTTTGFDARIDRRRALELAAGGGAALATMFAARRAPAQIGAQTELTIAMSSDPGHLDPRVERETFDDAKVKAALFRAQELIWDDAPWIFLYDNPEVNAINRRLQWSGGRRDEYAIFTGASIGA
jgi:hypothetical protein